MRHWLAVALIALVLAAGCGRKGPLYLPDEDTDNTEQTDDQEGQ